MPNLLSTLKEQKLREEYGDYCLRGILRGRGAKPFEEFRRVLVIGKAGIVPMGCDSICPLRRDVQ
jgi:hypothetical protein